MAEDNVGSDPPLSGETTPLSSGERRRSSEYSSRHGRFIPGTLFGKRYRIIGLLGRGGMGEVYGADDLELGQTVALKLLPERLTSDECALTALRNEVRVARQISHPNVCRVYDIGEVDGQHFVSMEYVDGEDLAGLLRRIGRLPPEKATDIIRQLAAGLAAAHEMGVLHRDLKPANVMIDGRGRVHIMDFGLAGFTDELRGTKGIVGTLSYMAPEQLSGKGTSMRSDVYSLGLVMYEVLTGKRPYDSGSIAELRDRQAAAPPSSPSVLVSDCDPIVERVVMRCLEFDPERRPPSAQAVAAALPGGDPLAAALAAGETPSPEMVAAAGGRGSLRQSLGLGLLGAVLLSFVAIGLLNDKVALFRLARPGKPTVVLADRAREILAQLGYPDRPVDVAYGFSTSDLLRHVEATDNSVGRWNNLGTRWPTPFTFWYREHNTQMMPFDELSGRIGWSDPPFNNEGMLRMSLDQSGRLRRFERVPPLRQARSDSASSFDWRVFFSLAQLDPAAFHGVEPIWWNPPLAADDRKAWEGSYPGPSPLPVRIEAGASNGKPLYFILWDTGPRDWLLAQPSEAKSEQGKVGGVLNVVRSGLTTVIVIIGLLVPALIAWRNVRLRKTDSRSAFRYGLFAAALTLLSGVLTRAHVPGLRAEIMSVVDPVLLNSVGIGILIGLGYLAAEPYLRRQWPDLLISWTRLTSGRYRDPLVGRDVLIGAAAGAAVVTLYDACMFMPTWFGHPMANPRSISTDALAGGRLALGCFFESSFLLSVMVGPVILTLFLLLFQKKLLAVVAVFLVMTINMTDADLGRLSDPGQLAIFATDAITIALAFLVTIRVGLLALVAFSFFYFRLLEFPVTFDTSSWYASTSTLLLVALGAIALYAFRIATTGHSTERVQT
jgi:serine/threonine-protein kinase